MTKTSKYVIGSPSHRKNQASKALLRSFLVFGTLFIITFGFMVGALLLTGGDR